MPFRDIPQAMPPATVVRIAMVFLSGTFSPVEARSASGQAIARLLPLSYAAGMLRQAVNGLPDLSSFLIDATILSFFAVAFLWAAIRLFERGNA